MIRVKTAKNVSDAYPQATRWTIDDFNRLHIFDDDTEVGVYTSGFWMHVRLNDSSTVVSETREASLV